MCELYKVEDGTCLNEKQRDGLLDEVIGTIREFFGLRLMSINHIKNGEVNVTLLSDNKATPPSDTIYIAVFINDSNFK